MKLTVFDTALLPRHWLLPRKERALLAIIGTIFWAGTIWQALMHDAVNASVFSFFGLGLLYVVFSLSNLAGGLRIAVEQYTKGLADEAHPRTLTELFIVLLGMLILNAIVLVIYIIKGASFTIVDTISIGLDGFLIAVLLAIYGSSQLLHHPIARGWLAIAGKTVPQFVLAGLFIANPHSASGLALITLLGINALSLLRFFPTLKSYRQDRKNRHLAGLLLGEAGNTISGAVLTFAWAIARF